MIESNSRISLTYITGGKSLAKAGEYSDATINTKGDVITKSRTIVPPVYRDTKQNTILSESFIQMCLERPVFSKKRRYSVEEHTFMRNFKKLTDDMKIDYHVQQYVKSQGGEYFEWEII